MQIRMLETRRGTENGVSIREYRAGEYYEVSDRLARAFIAAGFAIEIITPQLCSDGGAKRRKSRKRKPILQLIKE